MPTGARLAVVVLVLALAACGDDVVDGSLTLTDDEGPMPAGATAAGMTMADLDDTTFVSTDATGHALVPASRVTLSIQGEVLSVSAGCNTMFAAAEVQEGVLRWTEEAASTLLACQGDLAAQDQWLSALFGEGVAATLGGEELVLRADEVTIRLAEQTSGAATEVLEGLLGERWVVGETIAGGVIERVPTSVRRPELDVTKDGTVALFTGCNTGRTAVEVDGDALVFSPAMVTKKACGEAADTVEQRVLAVLDGRVDVTLEGSVAVLTHGEWGVVVEVG